MWEAVSGVGGLKKSLDEHLDLMYHSGHQLFNVQIPFLLTPYLLNILPLFPLFPSLLSSCLGPSPLHKLNPQFSLSPLLFSLPTSRV